jgi:hypothetical protein
MPTRHATFQMAEVAVPNQLFEEILRLIDGLRPRGVPAWGHGIVRHVSTSFVERQNLTMRMSIRRFTRLTNALSKKLENHALSVALHYMHYNFCRIHKSLRVTAEMAAGVTHRLWD